MLREEEEDRVLHYLIAALERYRGQWELLNRKTKKRFGNDANVYQAYMIVNDMCASYQIKTLDGGILNDKPPYLKQVTGDVAGMIDDNEKIWREKLPVDVKAKYENNCDVFVGGCLAVYFNKEYELTLSD